MYFFKKKKRYGEEYFHWCCTVMRTLTGANCPVRSGERCTFTCVSVHLTPNIVDIQTKFILVVVAICRDC